MTPYLLHHYLADSVARFPEQTAVVAADRSLSYRQLDELSNRIAQVLRRTGVGKRDRVGIHLEKSLEAVAAIFGILKAGAAYVPMDPKAPVKRTAFVVDNCRLRGLVSTMDKLAGLGTLLGERPVCTIVVDEQADGSDISWSEVLKATAAPLSDAGLTEQDLAYILYTSGSTGEPKGVMLSHRAALSFVNWSVEFFALDSSDRFSSHAPLHFDLSVFDLFAAAAVGASVALVPQATALFPRNLAHWIDATGITVWYSVPSALVQLALYGGLERYKFTRLKRVLFAGEPFPVEHLRRLMSQLPHPAYFNLYGPTETNVCTVYTVAEPPRPGSAPLPIGRACANTEVFALNEEGALAAVGETGELFVTGPTLMRGYWGRPEKSAEVLVPHPMRPEAPSAYRTGDLVRLDAGNYHFLGRRDSQVKSRGYRIELGDVEAVLYRHPAVAEAAVVTRPHPELGCVLRGIIVLRANETLTRKQIAAFCAEYLPPYMIPEDFAFPTDLPKTSSGKVDRAALQRELADAVRGCNPPSDGIHHG